MRTVNIHEEKTYLSRLVDEAAKGNVFIIAKAGKPMVRVLPLPLPQCDSFLLDYWDSNGIKSKL